MTSPVCPSGACIAVSPSGMSKALRTAARRRPTVAAPGVAQSSVPCTGTTAGKTAMVLKPMWADASACAAALLSCAACSGGAPGCGHAESSAVTAQGGQLGTPAKA